VRRGASLAAALSSGALLLLQGCAAFPGAAAAGERAKIDAFVAVTSPIQVPWVAGREAWDACDGEGKSSKLLLPAYFVGYLLAHTGLAVAHTADLVVTPIHLIAGNGPAGVYRGCEFPLERQAPLASRATGELALYGAASVSSVLIAYWFTTYYVPALARHLTGG